LEVFRSEPPERVIEADDIVFCDFGPVFEDWEADFGRTFVIGDDPHKVRLRDSLPLVFDAGRAYFRSAGEVTGEQLFAHMVQLAEDHGWRFGGQIAGHLVGEFPHETIDGERIESYIAPGNATTMRRTDRAGRLCHWILEVHLVDLERQIGAFYEQLLDLG
jgi:Xaa-Pro aminopeptidase